MQIDWPNRDSDLNAALEIIAKHIDFNDGEPLGVVSIDVTNDKIVACEVADWVLEILEFFSNKYGYDVGMAITQKVVSICIINHETVH